MIDKTWTPIFAITREFKLKSPKCTVRRKQFPLQQSTGKTVHKSQGCTVPEVAVSLCDFTHRNAFYVACSRVCNISKLHILNFAPNQIRTDKHVTQEMERMRSEQKLVLNFQLVPKTSSHFSIFYGNIQSLNLHFPYIKHDYLIQRSNIVLFNETHLTDEDQDENYHIPGFNMSRFNAVRYDSTRRPFNGLIAYTQKHLNMVVISVKRTLSTEYMILHVMS